MDDADDGRTTYDGRRLDGYTVSSPCEPNGSGELKIQSLESGEGVCFNFKNTKAENYLSTLGLYAEFWKTECLGIYVHQSILLY